MNTNKKSFFIANLILACFLAFFVVEGISASEGNIAEEFHFRSVRAMGMGNTFAAVANDGDAIYYNPAGLTNIRRTIIDIQPVRIIPSQDVYDQLKNRKQLMDDLGALSETGDPLEDPNLEDERRRLMERMESLLADDFGLDAGIPVRAIVPFHIGSYGLAIGLMSHGWSMTEVAVERRGLDWSNFVMDVLDDEVIYDSLVEASYGAAAAVELPLTPLPLEMSFGLSARRLKRWRLTDRDDPLGLDDLLNPFGPDGIEGNSDDLKARYFDPDDPWSNVSEGKGYCVDAGVIGSFNDAINLAVVARNAMGNVEYEDGTDDELPVDFSASGSVNLTRLSGPGIPLMDVIVAGEVNEDEEIRLGLEVVWDMPLLELSGRIGSNDGYLTFGAGIDLLFLDFDYAFYSDQNTDWHAFALSLSF